jgi:gliding motility-associated-like protein
MRTKSLFCVPYLFMKPALVLLLAFFSVAAQAQENCANGRDDDGDGRIDLQDSDCSCNSSFVRTREMSIIPNHSFESTKCCPSGYSQMRCVNDWIQPAQGTSDLVSSCSDYGDHYEAREDRVPHVPLPVPDGEAIVGIINGITVGPLYSGLYKEYIATRLWRTLDPVNQYEIELSIGFGKAGMTPFNVTIWGHPDVTGLPFYYDGPICPSTYDDKWIVLGSAVVSGANEWVETTIPLNIPYDINCLAIGPDCADKIDSFNYYYMDNVLLYKKENLGKFYVDLKASPKCDATETLASNLINDSYQLQWYKNGIAIIGATKDSLALQNIPEDDAAYQLRAISPSGCQISEPYQYKSKPKLPNYANLGPDIIACPGETVTLSLEENVVEPHWLYYYWNDKEAAVTYDVTTTGDYWVEMTIHDIETFAVVCQTRDTVHVTFVDGATDFLGPDRTVCEGQPIEIGSDMKDVHHKWSTGEATSHISVSQPGKFADTIQLNGCAVHDEIQVTPNPLQLALGNDITVCEGTNVSIQPTVPAGTTYLWQDGSTSQNYTATTSGNVTLIANYDGCIKDDAVSVTFLPAPKVDLGKDIAVCDNEQVQLDATSAGVTAYNWNDGTTSPLFTPHQSGQYVVKVIGQNTCAASDTINIEMTTAPTIQMLQKVDLCRGGSVEVNPIITGADLVQWSDGSTTFPRTFSSTGTYTINAQNSCGAASAKINIADAGICTLHLPNAFSPNRDGVNDLFIHQPLTGLEKYSLTVYNRWGQIIFHTTQLNKGWDGMKNGKPQPSGAYVWKATFVDGATGKIKHENGTLLLVR